MTKLDEINFGYLYSQISLPKTNHSNRRVCRACTSTPVSTQISLTRGKVALHSFGKEKSHFVCFTNSSRAVSDVKEFETQELYFYGKNNFR